MCWSRAFAAIALVGTACNSGDELEPPPPAIANIPPESAQTSEAGPSAEDTDANANAGSSGDATTAPEGASTEGDQCPGAAAEGEWADLYRCYFGATGIANCGQSDSCHQTSAGVGTESSGFVCGQTADSCWRGMTSSSLSFFSPIVPTDGGPPDVTSVTLWSVLRKTSGQGLNDMPYAPTTVVFAAPDMARIAAWIQRGAPND
ncbi:MAG TPA: hypothetical protein VK841_03680 [Polyangiaceae bacterium]|jgi:hypothetical protein|nr:hypothetical protein [Polyangiaceae bacterium]